MVLITNITLTTEELAMFKVRCKFVSFLGDAERFPCHFHYKTGDEFYYDGVHFTGRICPGLLASMMPVIWTTHLMGNRCYENIMFRYRGLDALEELPRARGRTNRWRPPVPAPARRRSDRRSCYVIRRPTRRTGRSGHEGPRRARPRRHPRTACPRTTTR